MVTEQYYDPEFIFKNLENSSGMVGLNNNDLATNFFRARYNDNDAAEQYSAGRFNRNAGAVQLYKEGGIEIYPETRDKIYHFISYGNKYFKHYTKPSENSKRSSYGHSERFLMWKILDDLLLIDPAHDVTRPSELSDLDGIEKEYQVLKKLTDEPAPYKRYLKDKGIIVKMWSERPACKDADLAGGGCSSFIQNILPEGSQFGYIVKDYTRADNVDCQKIETASTALRNAYLEFKEKRERRDKRDSSTPAPVSESKKTRTETE